MKRFGATVQAATVGLTVMAVCCMTIQPAASQGEFGYPGYSNTQTQTNTQADYQGQVNMNAEAGASTSTEAANPNAQPAANLQESIKVEVKELELQKDFAKHHEGVSVLITNNAPYHVQVMHAEVLNAKDEERLAKMVADKKNRKRRGFGAALRGIASVPLAFVPYGGYGAAIAVHSTRSAMYAGANIANATANEQGETQGFAPKVANVTTSPGESVVIQGILDKGQEPQLKVIVKDLQTNQIYTIR